MTLLVQAAVLDGLLFDTPPFSQDGYTAAKVYIGRSEVADGPAPVSFQSFESDTRHQGDQIWQLYTATSSSGMQQPVGPARALAADPDILLMDEPISALDPLIRRQLQDQVMELSHKLGKTTLFITHDLDKAIRVGKWAIDVAENDVWPMPRDQRWRPRHTPGRFHEPPSFRVVASAT